MIEENILLARLAHEIKNPLTVCQGYLEMLTKAKSDTKAKYLSIIKNELKKSILLIDEFNNNEAELVKINFNLTDLFNDLKNTLFDIFIENNTEITIPTEELPIKADYNKLRQIFLNILKNSLEAKDKNKLYINIKVHKNIDDYTIYISDNGHGMTQEQLHNIFQAYYTTKKNGTGLGTINIKRIIELHAGKIEYLSFPNKGTTVVINLPIN